MHRIFSKFVQEINYTGPKLLGVAGLLTMGHGLAGGAVGLDAGTGAAGLGARTGPGRGAVNEPASEAPLLDAERAEAGSAGTWRRPSLSGKARTGVSVVGRRRSKRRGTWHGGEGMEQSLGQ